MDEKIKQYIIDETRSRYNGKNVENTIELFYDILDYPVQEESLAGVGNRIKRAINSLVNERHDKDSLSNLFPAINKIEQYARKILFFTDRSAYNSIVAEKKGFFSVIDGLGMQLSHRERSRMLELRNTEGHDCKDWTVSEFYVIISEFLNAYLVITDSQYDKMLRIVKPERAETKNNEQMDFKPYASNLVRELSGKAKMTVELDSEENLAHIDLFAVEQVAEDKPARKGTVRSLMATLAEKRMILWGEAGAGKTTSIEYLAYLDAQEYLKDQTKKLPVVLYLGTTVNEHYTVTEYIQNKLDIDHETVQRLLKTGKINLYLDGFNEIPMTEMNMLKTKRRREITELLTNYPKTFIVLTNRPQDGKEFSGIPIFNLLKMTPDQVNEFISRNTTDENVMAMVKEAIDTDKNLKELVKTPLILKSLIFVVKTTGEIPKREGQIIGKFLNALFIREKQEKYDEYLDPSKINLLLRRIGYETKESNQTNSGVTEEYLLTIMAKCEKDYGFTYDNLYAIKMMVHLGILEKRDNTYSFSHQSYQDYYHSQEMLSVLGI